MFHESHQNLKFLLSLYIDHLGFIMWPWNPPTSWPTPPSSSCPASPPTPVTPWTTQPTPAHQSSPLLGQPPPSMTMQPTPATTFSHGPPEHVFGQTILIFTYIGPTDSLHQHFHLNHLFSHNLCQSIHIS